MRNIIAKILFLIFTICLSLFTLALFFTNYEDVSETHKWIRASANIYSSSVIEYNSGGKIYFNPQITISYYRDGQYHTASLETSTAQGYRMKQIAISLEKKFPENSSVEVFINPLNINQARLTSYSLGFFDYNWLFCFIVSLWLTVKIIKTPSDKILRKKNT